MKNKNRKETGVRKNGSQTQNKMILISSYDMLLDISIQQDSYMRYGECENFVEMVFVEHTQYHDWDLNI